MDNENGNRERRGDERMDNENGNRERREDEMVLFRLCEMNWCCSYKP